MAYISVCFYLYFMVFFSRPKLSTRHTIRDCFNFIVVPVRDVIYVCIRTIIYKSVIYNLGDAVESRTKTIESLQNNAVFPVGHYIFQFFFFFTIRTEQKKKNNNNANNHTTV